MRSNSDGTKPVEQVHIEASGDVGYLLFDSLVHHLIEKGVLTKNDALSVVQTAAQLVRGRIHAGEESSPETIAALTILQRTYSSFEAIQDRRGAPRVDGGNIHSLRPPLHGDRPQFPSED
jgi:hypothetical protein